MKRDTQNEIGLEPREDLMRGFEAEDFARTVVERVFDGGELLMAEVAQVHALGQELADEAAEYSPADIKPIT